MLAETLAGVAIVAAVVFTVCIVKAVLPGSRVFPEVERDALLRCAGDAEGLEAAVRETCPGETVYIVDMGMTPQARRRAEILAKRCQGRIIVSQKDDWKVLTDGR